MKKFRIYVPLRSVSPPMNGIPSPEAKQESVQIKRSEYSLCPGLQLALNHGCSSLVWPGTRSNSTWMPFSWAALNSAAASALVP